jgi:LysR family transcriptional regulator, chromosome initiation inhibitor
VLDYPALFALAAVIQEGSFERAAHRLNVTPSAVSQRIRQLEERVGGALVVRAHPCVGTELGRLLCQHVHHIHVLEHDLQALLPAMKDETHSPVNVPIAVNADSLATWFMPALAAFTQAHSVLVQVTVDDERHTIEWLRKGTVLAAVTASENLASGSSATPLGSMRYVAAASPMFIARYFPSGVHLQDLQKAPSLRFNAKDELQQKWVDRHFGQGLALPGHDIASPHAFVAAAQAGMGWALHPQTLVNDALRSGQLVELLPGSHLDVPLYWQQARSASGLLSELRRSVMAAAPALTAS